MAPPHRNDRKPHRTRTPFRGCVASSCLTMAGLVAVAGAALFWFYAVDSRHENRNTIWPLRGRNLIPPAATDITLHRDLLTHYAVYTIAEKDLNAFLDERFAFHGAPLDSFSERSRPPADLIGKPIGHFDWVVTGQTVLYSYSASNGSVSDYYHDPASGRTFQISEYW